MEAVAVTTLVRTLQASLAVIAALLITSYKYPVASTVSSGSTFDFIVVGGGTGGSVVANRLTEISGFSVLLIEAGGDPPLESVLPGLFTLIPNSGYDYNFTSEDDGYTSQNLINEVVGLTAGNMLGGSSSLHHLIHVRGNLNDYNLWASIANDESFTYDNLLEYFIKSERLEDDDIQSSSSGIYHGYEGNMRLSRQLSDDNELIFQAFAELGLDEVLDSNDPNFGLGISEPMLNIADGYRQGAAESYLSPLVDRTNFSILKNTKVTRVLFDDNNNAIGVEAVNADGDTVTYYSNREVILSAGALVTPQILMLSGVGPSDHLTSFDIPVISDLPVGQNMVDHIPAIVVTALQEADPVTDPTNYHLFPVPTTTGYHALDLTQAYSDYQTINLIFPADSTALLQFCSIVFSYKDEICQGFFDGVSGRVSLFTVHNMMQPLSRGEVRLRSASADDHPLVNHGIYSNATDLENMALYLQDFARIVDTTAFQSVNAEIVDLGLDCVDFDTTSLDYWRCYALNLSATMWHYSSTCAIGSVIDTRFRVNGVSGVRVVDASAMPGTISGNINAGIVVLAEKASDIIKQDYGASPRV